MLKKVAIALALVLLLVAGLATYLWTQATALPEWYAEGDLSESDLAEFAGESPDGEPAASPQWIALDEQGNRLQGEEPVALPPPFAGDRTPVAEAPESEASLPERAKAPKAKPRHHDPRAKRHELRGFHVRRGKDGKRKRSPAVKASRAIYEEGRLEIGVILDLSRLPKDKLKKRDRARYERAIANFPGITQRDVWVGVEDAPISVGGYLQLSPEAEIRVGKLTYSLASAAKRMGMSQMEMRMELNRELRRLGFSDPEA